VKKVGMVGVGAISPIYLQNLTKIFRDVELVAVCDLVRERAEKAQADYGVPKIYDTMHELFADPDIDIVLNLTRPYEHFEVTKAALLAGKHVYSEKPLGATWEEGVELVKLAQANNLMIGGAPDTFMGAGIQTCRRLIDSGFIGKPLGGAARMMCRGHESWHPDPEFYYKFGGGPMMDMGPYYVTALVNMLGGVKSVIGSVNKMFDTRLITSQPFFGTIVNVDIPTHLNGILQFDSGAEATITTSFDTVYHKQDFLEIYGTEGTLYCPDPNYFCGPVKALLRKDGEIREMPLQFDYNQNSRGLGLADMAAAIDQGRTPRASYKTTLHVLEIMTHITKSSQARRTLDLTTKYTPEKPMPTSGLPGVIEE